MTVFDHLPQAYLRLFSPTLLLKQFEESGRRLERLPPSTQVHLTSALFRSPLTLLHQVLASTVIALSAYSSSNPLLFSFGPPAPSFAFVNNRPEFDLRAFGFRRAQTCRILTERAIKSSWENGSMAILDPQNVASGYLLSRLLTCEFSFVQHGPLSHMLHNRHFS